MEAILNFITGALSGAFGAGAPETFISSADPATSAVLVPALLEYVAVVVGAISGSLVAYERRLDILGVCTLALVTSLGGGLTRDVILPTTSIYMLDHPVAVISCVVTGLVAFYFSGLLYKLTRPIMMFDILSVALFTFAGADKALLAGYGVVPCVLMGVVTGVGGGALRDVCLGQIPSIFKPGNLYATCSVLGAVTYLGLVELHVAKVVAALACVVVVVGSRWLSIRFNLLTVTPVDLTPKLTTPIYQIRELLKKKHSDNEAKR